MITTYHRPQSLEQALKLIARRKPRTVPLGGGTLLSHGQPEAIEVVDLQDLGLHQIRKQDHQMEVGATVTLQQLLSHEDCPAAMRPALKLEAPLNIRNAATVAGTIIVCDGRSMFTAVLLALDAKLTIMRPAVETVGLGDFLPVRADLLPGALVTGLEFPLRPRIALEYVSRTPVDKPIVAVAVAQWPSGRTRVAVAGFGSTPLLAMDGTAGDGAELAARNALHDSGDPWASAEYRMDVAATLTRRCLENVAG